MQNPPSMFPKIHFSLLTFNFIQLRHFQIYIYIYIYIYLNLKNIFQSLIEKVDENALIE